MQNDIRGRNRKGTPYMAPEGRSGGHAHKGTGRHSRGDGHDCPKHQPMQRFMETSLLLLLVNQTCHGYCLAEQLEDYGFADVNVSTLYRILRKMEDRGWVRSSWEQGGKGPQRRVYTITDIGMEALDEWVEVFRQRKTNIETLLARYEQMEK